MGAVIAFSVIILSFCLFGAAMLKQTFERTLPICTMGITVVLYIFGLLGLLRTGAAAIVLAAAAALGVSVYKIIIEKNFNCLKIK